jgi:hypothetical protein
MCEEAGVIDPDSQIPCPDTGWIRDAWRLYEVDAIKGIAFQRAWERVKE